MSLVVTTLPTRASIERRLARAADYFCSMELAALRYADHEGANTYIKLFGGCAFKANNLKQMRKKLHT